MGDYCRASKIITIYQCSVAKYAEHFITERAGLEDICLAHEFFHALEHLAIGDTRIHVRKKHGWLSCLRSEVFGLADEIAAHTFAKKLLQLERMPNILHF